jgi:hypothetical protein
MINSLKYIILVILFIILVFSVTVSTLFIKYETKGNFVFSKNYSYIKYSNVSYDNDDIVVKMNEEDNYIHVSIPSLEKNATISLDMVNIGNEEVVLDNYSITNIDTELNKDNININVTINKDDVIKGGTTKKIIINVSNNNKESGYLNFNVNCSYKES